MMRTFGKTLGFLTRKGFLIQMEVSYLLITKTDKGNTLSECKIMCPRSTIMSYADIQLDVKSLYIFISLIAQIRKIKHSIVLNTFFN